MTEINDDNIASALKFAYQDIMNVQESIIRGFNITDDEYEFTKELVQDIDFEPRW